MSASTSIRDRATATFSTLAAIDHLAQETGRRAKAATVDRARAAVKAALAGLDNRLRAALHRHGGCARWDHDIRDEPGDDWISKASSDGHGRTIMVRCHQCRLWLWLSDDGWELMDDGASRTCSWCGKDCPANWAKCPRCNATEAPVSNAALTRGGEPASAVSCQECGARKGERCRTVELVPADQDSPAAEVGHA